MTEAPKTSMNCLAGCWLVAAAFGFSVYVMGLVFFGEANAIPVGLATWVGLGLILSYLYCYMPQKAAIKEWELQDQQRHAAEAEAARRAAEAEPDFDWDAEEAPEIIDDVSEAQDVDEPDAAEFDIDVDGPDAALLDDDGLSDAGKPVGYDAPDGEADDLKQIKGIGPKLEEILNEMGIFHIAQIAEWGEAEIVWLDENLDGFKGRATRDEWVTQAQALIHAQEGDDDTAL